MNPTNKMKMLLALDYRSEKSLESVKYVAGMPAFHGMRAVLYTVFSEVPEVYLDFEDTYLASMANEMYSEDFEKREQANQFMEQASKILKQSNFSDEDIQVKIQSQQKGIARDIITEASNDYAWLVSPRRGVPRHHEEEPLLGSVALKILSNANFLPLMFIGNADNMNNKVLIAIDGSENSLRAVDFVGSVLGSHDYRVTMMHVIRGKQPQIQKLFAKKEIKEASQKSIEKVFEKAKTKLLNAGFHSDAIETILIDNVYSRSNAIVDEAVRNNYKTVVVGRRGLSKAAEFFMGRVSAQVVNMAKNQAVWVV